MSCKKLFVGNIPYSTTDGDLEKAFNDHGEVKACFTVKEPGVTDRCKGYGYVVFKTRESCDKAKALVKVIGGRPVKISLAETKAKSKNSKHESTVINGDHGNESDSDEHDYESMTSKRGRGTNFRKPKSERNQARFDIGRTVIVRNLPEGTTEDQLSGACQGVGEIQAVTVQVENGSVIGQVSFQNHKQARSAVHKLEGATVGGVKVNAVLLSKANKNVSQKTLKKSRLIVRNLSFKCDENHLEEVFSKHGQVLEVKVPRKENGHMLGYGFVQFSSYFAAARALSEINKHPIKGRPVAVDWVVPKDVYEQSITSKQNESQVSDKGSGKHGDKGGDKHGDKGGDKEHNPTDKDSDNESIASEDPVSGSLSENNEFDRSSGCESESRCSVDGMALGVDESIGSSNEGAESSSGDDEIGDESGSGRKSSDVTEGRTLFIRNLPVGAGYKELSQLFSQFGPVRYCRVLSDQNTGLNKGTAFLQFKNQSSVQPCLDTSANGGLCYHGNRLATSMAVTKEEAKGLKGQRSGGKEDKRNLYLAKEGLILPGSDAAQHLSKVDMARRMRSYSERKSKLANPNYFVSKTRLSVRNLPTGVDEKMLKRVLAKAIGPSTTKMLQVKILRSTDRVDTKGHGRSKGYGFVEFSSHDDALSALRATNNNPELFGEKRRLIVEFAVENSRAVNLRAQRKQRQLVIQGQRSSNTVTQSAEAPVTMETETTNNETSESFSKRRKWRLKWKERRLQRKVKSESIVNEREGDTKHEQTTPVTGTTGLARSVSGGRKRKNKVKIPTAQSTPGDKRVKKRIPDSDEGVKRNKTSEREMNKKQKLSVTSPGRVKGHRRRGGDVAQVEEAKFEKMVNKYRQRLEKFSDSRWFN